MSQEASSGSLSGTNNSLTINHPPWSSISSLSTSTSTGGFQPIRTFNPNSKLGKEILGIDAKIAELNWTKNGINQKSGMVILAGKRKKSWLKFQNKLPI